MSIRTERLALGTVQFGLTYGVANNAGQVTSDEVSAILRRASRAGIDTLDTAVAYGDSERRLGGLGIRDWKIVTKLPRLPPSITNVQAWVRETVSGSLGRLGIERLYGLLLHRSQDLLGPRGSMVHDTMQELKDEGFVDKIGVSIYAPSELGPVSDRFALDLVQAPYNVFDRQIAASGWLSRLNAEGTEVHARSAFLQGLLLMPSADRPLTFARWEPLWNQWDAWLGAQGLTPLQGAIRFVLAEDRFGRVLVGVDNSAQLEAILAAVEGPVVSPPPSLSSDDRDLINPSCWAEK